MTDRKDALVELLAKVEASCLDEVYCLTQHVNGIGMNASMWQAYSGSLDAAKALHEAVLQGWAWSLYEEDSGEFLSIVSKGYNVKIYQANWHTDPARAWLIAILKALIAGEDTNDNDKGE
jgi:hypothetical protein